MHIILTFSKWSPGYPRYICVVLVSCFCNNAIIYKTSKSQWPTATINFLTAGLWNSRESSASGSGSGLFQVSSFSDSQLPYSCSFHFRWQKHKRANQATQAHLKLPIEHDSYPSSLAKARRQEWGREVCSIPKGSSAASYGKGDMMILL